MKKRIIRGCLRIATLAVAGGVLGWLSSILFGERALITELPVVVDRKSTRLNSSHTDSSRMPSSA